MKINLEAGYKHLINNYKKNPLFFIIWLPLFFLSIIYGLIIRYKRKRGYKNEVKDVFIISIGNITAGGTGKTPHTIYLVKELKKQHISAGVLMRGYKSKIKKEVFVIDKKNISPEIAGDEPYLIFTNTKVPVIIAKEREKGALKAKKMGINYLILDDGFQYFGLKRDVNIVLIDYTNPFSNKKLIPAGLLREPLSSLKYADFVIISRYDPKYPAQYSLSELTAIIRRYTDSPIFVSELKLNGIYENNKKVKIKKLLHKKIIAISGIGNPDYFVFMVKKILKPEEIKAINFPDHYNYSLRDVELMKRFIKGGWKIITTEKDYIKLRQFNLEEGIFFIKISVTIQNTGILLRKILRKEGSGVFPF